MTGTLAGALEARGIPSYPDKLRTDAEGTITAPEGVMKVTHIRVRYHLQIPRGKRPEAERALAVFERGCPVAQTLKGCVTIEHSAEIEEESR
ncbi:MAG TPA: OsmC family protein [bacterium]